MEVICIFKRRHRMRAGSKRVLEERERARGESIVQRVHVGQNGKDADSSRSLASC